mmetsp:Transcript_3154/g.5275  ORF Transcript_3154/g.5275 Transcript_3154/m.5275 type:complete len:97 (+) Transcript_3154:629-919(+)|eukprot:CAMPEP_0168623402 /NCGR_PEP_ID=MMETSP0449_2-20121227/8805_1 /TAXON_ID=1082188 /ORGANISM="Strombidium rassoulzadegani, Strain ras09" /LENGTH=96 /DNA_ID=CAMNT_0008664779 /DNA_START=588 /DNA_END=878 /DNA_ORIENTATION=-
MSLNNKLKSIGKCMNSANPSLKVLLIQEQLKPVDFIKMKESDMAPNDVLEMVSKQMAKYANELRTDGEAQHQLLNSVDSSLHKCFKCKGRKLTFYQ